MGGFLLVNKNSEHINLKRGLDIFNKKKQKILKDVTFEGYRLITFSKRFFENQNFFRFNKDDFVVSIGTPIYKRNKGHEAAVKLYNDFRQSKSLDFSNFYGHFCYLIFIDKKLFMFNDYNGMYHVYHDANYNIFSNSFLAVSASLNSLQINKQGIYEYILFGSTYGEDTTIKGIRRLDNKRIFQFFPELSFIDKTIHLNNNNNNLKFDELVDNISLDLIDYFDAVTKNFQKFSLGLSGGFDSRLILSLLLNFNIKPYIYVNGLKDSLEVNISRSISQFYELEFENYVENENLLLEKISLDEIIKEKFYLDEGLNLFGIFYSMLSKDVEISQKVETNLNGSGGELYRAFRGLPSKQMDLNKYISLKYHYQQDFLTNKFNREIFYEKIKDKILYNLDIPHSTSKLTHKMIDLVPPTMRGRYWTGVLSSKLNQFCYSLLPFLEPQFFIKSTNIPYRYKLGGRFEAALIKKINPELAKFNSNYGFNFYNGPDIYAKRKDLLKMYTPLFIKHYLIKNKAFQYESLNYIKEKEKIIFNCHDMLISEYIDLNKIKDKLLYSRALTTEYLFRNLFNS